MNIMKNQLSSQTFQAPAFRGADQPVSRYKKERQKQGYPMFKIIFKKDKDNHLNIFFPDRGSELPKAKTWADLRSRDRPLWCPH